MNFGSSLNKHNTNKMTSELLNPNPTVYKVVEIVRNDSADENVADEFDSLEVFSILLNKHYLHFIKT
jgi:hypothetical protein